MKYNLRLFQNGVDFDAAKLYPAIEFPVSRGTPMIAPLVKWDHKENYYVMKFDEKIANDKSTLISLQDGDFEFITGHEIDGKILLKA